MKTSKQERGQAMLYRFKKTVGGEERELSLGTYRELFTSTTITQDVEDCFTIVHHDREVGYVLRPTGNWTFISGKIHLAERPQDHFTAAFYPNMPTMADRALNKLMRLRSHLTMALTKGREYRPISKAFCESALQYEWDYGIKV